MSTPRRVCLQVSGVKLKHEESVEASHPPVSSCMSVYTSVLTHSNKLAVTFGSYGVYGVCLCAEQKLSHTSHLPTPLPSSIAPRPPGGSPCVVSSSPSHHIPPFTCLCTAQSGRADRLI